MKQEQYWFDMEVSQIIKGIAIIIMVFHHLFGNLEWIVEGNSFLSIPLGNHSLEYFFAVPGKICISIYAFLSGYGLYASYQHRKQGAAAVVKRVFSVLTNWWLIVLLCFLPLALICGQQIDGKTVLGNLLLLENNWCPFADYLLFYVTALITYPGIHWLLNKVNKPLLFFFGTPFAGIVIRKAIDIIVPEGILYQILYFYFLYIAYITAGSCVCQSKIFLKLHNWLQDKKWNKTWLKGILVFSIVPLRWLVKNKLIFDSFFATILVFLLVELIQKRQQSLIFRGIHFLGKHSTNIWFLHAIFFFSFAEYTQWMVYSPSIPLVIMVWCIVCCLPFSSIINFLHQKLWQMIEREKCL